jgi:threonine dehydratase
MLTEKPELREIILTLNRIRPWIHKTPVMTSRWINKLSGSNVYFKCENFQKVGAFKYRGAVNAILQIPEEFRKKGVATHSSGNHAQALALAATMQNVKSFIVMPENAPIVKRKAVEEYGANIITCKPNLSSREETLDKVVKETGSLFIHPYNNYDIIAGQATCCYELIGEINNLDAIITPVGGGGLLSGTCLSAHHLNPSIKIFGAEPAGAPDAFKSLQNNKIVPSVNPNSIADGLLTSLGDKTFPIIRDHISGIILVEDSEIIEAMKYLWERMKIIVEPSGAVPFAALLKNKENFENKNVGIILSGGNVDLSHLNFL